MTVSSSCTSQTLVNEEVERVANRFAKAENAIFIQVTREAEGQDVIMSQRGVNSYALPVTQFWRGGQRVAEVGHVELHTEGENLFRRSAAGAGTGAGAGASSPTPRLLSPTSLLCFIR